MKISTKNQENFRNLCTHAAILRVYYLSHRILNLSVPPDLFRGSMTTASGTLSSRGAASDVVKTSSVEVSLLTTG